MRCLLCWVFSLLLLLNGCGKSSLPDSAAGAATETELAGVLAEMTQALRKYSAEKRQVPASLNDLVAAGYLKNLPQPPPGKTFGIDSKKLQVVVK